VKEDERDDTRKEIGDVYNVPPEVPRASMWEAIRPRLAVDAVSENAKVRPAWQWGTLAAAAAGVVLLIGFGLGRVAQPAGPEVTPPLSVAERPAEPSGATSLVRVAAIRHLAATQTLLFEVGTEAESGAIDPNIATWATQLLTDTRLMLDSSLGDQGDMRALLEDLELILVQVVHASKAGAGLDAEVGRMELQQLTRGMQDNDVLPRIQQLLPPVAAGAVDE